MATFNDKYKGWEWTPEEKGWIKTWQRKLQNRHKTALGEVQGFKKALPAFAEEAEKVASVFVEACGPLLALDGRNGGRKFQSISPDEAREHLRRANEAAECWNRFASRADVQAAIKAVTARRNAERRQVSQAVEQHLAGPEFDRQIDALAGQVISQINFWIDMLHGGYGRDEVAILRRLAQVHFIRHTYGDGREDDLRPVVQVKPPVRDVLRAALRALVRDKLRDCVRGKGPSPSDVVMGDLTSACMGLDRSVKGWREKGILPKDIAKGYFTIQGVDYSVGAVPE